MQTKSSLAGNTTHWNTHTDLILSRRQHYSLEYTCRLNPLLLATLLTGIHMQTKSSLAGNTTHWNTHAD
ncbi:hypothetical protein DPMN_046592 [Dreissena polymorpha]|uniref:Uncharacterized protein n=1 Tax=Dreissena polymorpha TaxID=45954 RepID=A0A9D4D857_DREPO|nr:hypothetical protein DPMN_046592 [Dreissena polymorpha]